MTVTYWRQNESRQAGQKSPPPETKTAAAEAYIDRAGADGWVEGWARGPAGNQPVALGFWLDGTRVGGATADLFRDDLLAAGIGHGHYGFRGRIAPGVMLHGKLQLREGDQTLAEMHLSHGRPAPGAAGPCRVESLLAAPERWSMADVRDRTALLELDENLRRWGERRFLAMVCKFLLGRWPEAADEALYLADLRRGALAPDALFAAICDGPECRTRALTPLSPYDRRFPFRLAGSMREANNVAPIRAPAARRDCTRQLAAACLVSRPWPQDGAQLEFYERLGELQCHPPAEGSTVAKIAGLALAGSSRAQVKISIGDLRSKPIEFAMLLARQDEDPALVLARFEPAERHRLEWHRVLPGGSRLIQTEGDIGAGPADLFIATRMAPGAADNYYAWARFSSLSIDGDMVAAPKIESDRPHSPLAWAG